MGIVSDLLKKEEPVKQPPTPEDIAAVLKTEFGIDVSEAKKRYNQKQRQAEDRKRRYELLKEAEEKQKQAIKELTEDELEDGRIRAFFNGTQVKYTSDLVCPSCGKVSESALGYLHSYVEGTEHRQCYAVFGTLYIPVLREVVQCPACREHALLVAHTIYQGEKGIE